MKFKFIAPLILTILFTACISIPKETVDLSQVLGKDLVALHQSHRNVVEMYYRQIKNDINEFVDEVYSPFVIHYVLKIELQKYQKGEPSLYTSIENAGKSGGKAETDEALATMLEFQEAANAQITAKRNELLKPIIKQEKEVIGHINQSYENAIRANSTITNYLISVRKVKESQQDALNIVGLEGADTLVTNSLVQVSELVSDAVEKGKEIDIKSDDAYSKLEEISNQIKKITNKN
ncbi:hypothetical protein [Carboxylicivirga sp. N1Y90]|uniref:hypothetical protein n=1 Tax=Carboxylicivirga fragile TaxID=3417571 RepID=UPI003D34877D